MHELCTQVEIQASSEKVWQVLTDFEKYPNWNPFIHHAIGNAEAGERIDITFRSASKEMLLHCQVIKAEPSRELIWNYHVVLPALFRGEHHFTIQPIGTNRVLFIDKEIFHGLLVPLQVKDIDTHSRRGFEAMDVALKTRAEAME